MEIWKDIQGYEGLYQVSNLGNVRSLNFKRTGETRNLTLKQCHGYNTVSLYKNGEKKWLLVHRLVALEFVDGYSNGLTVNHKNEIKTDNRAENLEWCTMADNIRYTTYRHPEIRENSPGRIKGGRNAWKYGGMPIQQISLDGNVVKTWEDTSEIYKKTNWNTQSITNVCIGERITAYGYKWRFAT